MNTIRVQLLMTWFTRYAAVTAVSATILGTANVSIASGHGASTGHATPEIVEAHDANARGIALGEYQIRTYYPVQAQKSIVQFALYATAKDKLLPEMRELADRRKHKIRDQVISVSRLVPLSYFDEPDLKTFRRRILLRLRRALPDLLIDEVYVSDFQLKVQSL